MSNIKTQFDSASGGGSGYLKASLDFMVADTRQGLTGGARDDFAAIKKYASMHPERVDVMNYVVKVESAFRKLAASSASDKPSNKM